jgi:hypothetical protein
MKSVCCPSCEAQSVSMSQYYIIIDPMGACSSLLMKCTGRETGIILTFQGSSIGSEWHSHP